MKLASLKAGGRDGTLVVVSRDLQRCVAGDDIAPTLQAALDDWAGISPRLGDVSDRLNTGAVDGAEPFDPAACAAPLPRAYQWADGSAYVNHVELVRRARGGEMPASFWTDPLMYQGGSDSFIGGHDPIRLADEDWGIDLEAEVAVITDDVPMGSAPDRCTSHIKLIMLVNDVSLRNLIPAELAKGFGFFQSKPASAFSPVAVTPDELGDAWDGGKVSLPMNVSINGEPFGKPNAGVDMVFEFPRLLAHAAKTRALVAGSIVGSGTISNKQSTEHGSAIKDGGVGYCCIAEVRMIETINTGKPSTPFLGFGDRVRIEMLGRDGASVFGDIDQTIEKYEAPQ
jgi:fumarylacetoacetate (FAA) hydrolase